MSEPDTKDPYIEDLKLAYQKGIIEGLTMYAWWDRGIQYVGTCGQTLEAAIALVKVKK